MTAVQTLPSKIAEPKAKRRINDPLPEPAAEAEEPEQQKDWRYWYDLECRAFIECQKQDGVPDDELITLEEVVAICKEARAEVYAEEQERKNAACR